MSNDNSTTPITITTISTTTTTTTTLLPWGGEQLATQRGEIRGWGRGGERRPNYTRYRPTSKEPTALPLLRAIPSERRAQEQRSSSSYTPAVGDADLTSPRCSLSLSLFPPFSSSPLTRLSPPPSRTRGSRARTLPRVNRYPIDYQRVRFFGPSPFSRPGMRRASRQDFGSPPDYGMKTVTRLDFSGPMDDLCYARGGIRRRRCVAAPCEL